MKPSSIIQKQSLSYHVERKFVGYPKWEILKKFRNVKFAQEFIDKEISPIESLPLINKGNKYAKPTKKDIEYRIMEVNICTVIMKEEVHPKLTQKPCRKLCQKW